MNLRFSIFSAFIPVSLKSQKRAKFPGADFLGTALKFRKRKKNLQSLLVYVLHKKREITHFHIAVVQRQQRNQRNVQEKCVAHVYFLFCLIHLLLF